MVICWASDETLDVYFAVFFLFVYGCGANVPVCVYVSSIQPGRVHPWSPSFSLILFHVVCCSLSAVLLTDHISTPRNFGLC